MGEEDRLYGMTSDSTIEIEAADPTYAVKVGSRLRAIRKQKRLSLQEVEASSGQEFKASVLGAYERGERAISVPRLQRLARFYNVPVDQLLPRDDADLGPDSVIDLERGAVLGRPVERRRAGHHRPRPPRGPRDAGGPACSAATWG